jgi:hypothetical protein
MRRLILSFALLIPLLGFSQEEKKFTYELHGFVKTDVYFDTRQTVDAREGQFLLYPKNEMLDWTGADINAASKFHMLSIQSRLKLGFTGPDVLGAKVKGYIEGAFFGNIGTDINGFRLRHAFVKLTWPSSSLLVGQYWHPMFVTKSFPGTVSFNTGVPFQPFTRNPQIRFVKNFGNLSILAAAMEEIDFVSAGPLGPRAAYSINSSIPELDLRLDYKMDAFYFAVGVNYKTLKPRLSETTNTYTMKMDDLAHGLSFYGTAKLTTKPLTIRLYGVYAQMTTSFLMLGGYAETGVDSIAGPSSSNTMVVSGYTYKPYNVMSTWIDLNTNGKKFQFGLFAGYTKNLGVSDPIVGATYARGRNIASVYRISPRFIYNVKKFRIAPELDYTVASYATKDVKTGKLNIDDKGVVTDSKSVGNLRILLGVYYFF